MPNKDFSFVRGYAGHRPSRRLLAHIQHAVGTEASTRLCWRRVDEPDDGIQFVDFTENSFRGRSVLQGRDLSPVFAIIPNGLVDEKATIRCKLRVKGQAQGPCSEARTFRSSQSPVFFVESTTLPRQFLEDHQQIGLAGNIVNQ